MQDPAPVMGLARVLATVERPSSATAPSSVPAAPVPDPEVARQAALKAARDEGFAAGMRDAEATIAERVARAEAALVERQRVVEADLEAERARCVELLDAVPAELAAQAQASDALAVEIATVAITRLIAARWSEGDLIVELCRSALAEHRPREAVIRLSPADARLLGDRLANVDVVPDDTVPAGGCWIDSPRGRVRTGLDVRLAELVRALLAALDAGYAR